MRIFRTKDFHLSQVTHQTVLLDRVSLTGEESVARQHQPHQVTLGATAGEHTCIASLIADLSTQPRSEEHTSELQSHRDLHSFPTRRSSDLRKRRAPTSAPSGYSGCHRW